MFVRVEIIPQDENESAGEFEKRINGKLKKIQSTEGFFRMFQVQFTSDQNGRQTCNVQYQMNSNA